MLIQNLNIIPTGYFPAGNDAGENTSFRHDTITGLMVNRAFGMTFFTDLGDFQDNGVAEFDATPNGQAGQIDPPGSNILGKIPKIHIKSLGLHTLDIFHRQQADLPMPGAGMGISFYSVIF